MSVADKVRALNYFAQASFINASGTLERVHQTVFEIPVSLAQSMGYSAKKAEMIKSTHKRVLSNLHGGMRKSVDELGGLVVDQVGEIEALTKDLAAMNWNEKATAAKARHSQRQADAAKIEAQAKEPKPVAKAAKAAKKPAPRKKTSKKKGAA